LNNEEREQSQDQEKRDQFRKFYDNREQSMKTYVDEKSENQERTNQAQEEVFEDIDSTEENDRDDQNDQFVYNLYINSSDVCKKCDEKKEIFKSNNAFHVHIRDCIIDDFKLNISSSQESKILLVIKSRVKETMQKDYDL
jgi:hypothetical protein